MKDLYSKGVDCGSTTPFMQGFELESVGGKSRYKFTCCQNNANVLDTHNSAREDKQVIYDITHKKKCYTSIMSDSWGWRICDTSHIVPDPITMKEHFKDHHFSCRLSGDQEILRAFAYTETNTKNKKYSAYEITCARLKKKFTASCESMESGWTASGYNLSLLNGLQVDCRSGLLQNNGKTLDDGERRFLNQIKVEKQGSKFRYKFKCCRIIA